MTVITFVWDDVFTTGLDSIDEQHHRLIDIVNELSATQIDGGDGYSSKVQTVLNSLSDYASQHFAEEEQLMEDEGVDLRHVSHHKAAHRRFAEQVATMWMSRHSMATPVNVLLEFLVAWLSFHILGEDQTLAEQVKRIKAGDSPAQAYDTEVLRTNRDRTTSALLGAVNKLYFVLSKQNEDLASSNQLLEARVIERTRELEMVNQRLELLSRTDGLLGIANRMYFDDRLKTEWKRARRDEQPLSILMMDVDYFKRYNDLYGHIEGDACLRSVALAATEGMCRPTDLVARYGGEEIVALLPDTTLEGAWIVAERIQARLRACAIPHADSDVSDQVTLSIGVACLEPSKEGGADSLLLAADVALYQAKNQGRNQIFVKRDAVALKLAKG